MSAAIGFNYLQYLNLPASVIAIQLVKHVYYHNITRSRSDKRYQESLFGRLLWPECSPLFQASLWKMHSHCRNTILEGSNPVVLSVLPGGKTKKTLFIKVGLWASRSGFQHLSVCADICICDKPPCAGKTCTKFKAASFLWYCAPCCFSCYQSVSIVSIAAHLIF